MPRPASRSPIRADKSTRTDFKTLLSKVPEVTIYFWVIKILATTVGETAADSLSVTLHLGLTTTTFVMSALLAIGLAYQFRATRYVPPIYWLVVVLISVVGTLITDNLTDRFGVSLKLTTLLFGLALVMTFAVWQANEKTLSIHSILTPKREAFYWLAILFTFALGTAAGDLVAETLNLGYWKSALMFAAGIALIAAAWRYAHMNAIQAFWLAYILTRPLGASLGDFLSQSRHDGGLGLGPTTTSALFLATILAVVVYLVKSRKDQVEIAVAG
ncbi:MAG: COG4705 family protein [Acidimicrobiales bacterium]